MVHTGNEWAIAYRDRIVAGAQSGSSIIALKQNDRFRAALLDFGSNLYGAIVDTLGGLGVIVPYPVIAYRGCIGGIVSISSSHVSRLADSKEAIWDTLRIYLIVIPLFLAASLWEFLER